MRARSSRCAKLARATAVDSLAGCSAAAAIPASSKTSTLPQELGAEPPSHKKEVVNPVRRYPPLVFGRPLSYKIQVKGRCEDLEECK